MNKKIKTEIAIGVILLIAIVVGVIFWSQDRTMQAPTAVTSQLSKDSNKITNANINLVSSDYGFSFSVPAGWHIWEGNSAASDLMNKPEFAPVLKSGVATLTSQRVKEYQTFMDSWKAESSEVVAFTDSQMIDYKNRSFSEAGKIMSRLVDSEDTLKQIEITMIVSNSEVILNDAPVNDEIKESRSIKVNGNDASLLISKKMKLVDWIIIKMPINSNKIISGKKVSSLVFGENVRKNDPIAVDKLTSFISSLGVSDNQ